MEKVKYTSTPSEGSSSSDPIAQHDRLSQQWQAEGFTTEQTKKRHERKPSDTSTILTSSASTLPASRDGDDECLLRKSVATSSRKQRCVDKWVEAQVEAQAEPEAARHRGYVKPQKPSWLSSWWSKAPPPKPEVPIQVPRIRPMTPPPVPPPSVKTGGINFNEHHMTVIEPDLNRLRSSMTSSSGGWSQVSVVEVKQPVDNVVPVLVETEQLDASAKFSDDFAEQEQFAGQESVSSGSIEVFPVDWSQIESAPVECHVDVVDEVAVQVEPPKIELLEFSIQIDQSDDEDSHLDTDEIPVELPVVEHVRTPIVSDDEISYTDKEEAQRQPLMTRSRATVTRAETQPVTMVHSSLALRHPLEETVEESEKPEEPETPEQAARVVRDAAIVPSNVQPTIRRRRRQPDYIHVFIPRKTAHLLCLLTGLSIVTVALYKFYYATQRAYRLEDM